MAISAITLRRVKHLGRGMLVMSSFQLILCGLSIMLIAFTKEGNNPIDYKALIAAGFGVFTSLLGIAGAFGKLELVSRIYYVCNLWMLSTITTYLYMTIDDEDKRKSLCAPAVGSFSQTSNACNTKLAMAKGKLSLGAISLLVVFICCAISVNFEDALDDLHDQSLHDRLSTLKEDDSTAVQEIAKSDTAADVEPEKEHAE